MLIGLTILTAMLFGGTPFSAGSVGNGSFCMNCTAVFTVVLISVRSVPASILGRGVKYD